MTAMVTHTGGGWSVAVSMGGSQTPPPIERPMVVTDPESGPSIDTVVAAYLDDCRRRVSPATMLTYRQVLTTRGASYFADHNVTMLSELSDGVHLRAFLLHLHDDTELADQSKLTIFRTWHSLLTWCVEMDWLDPHARVFRVKPPKVAKKEPPVITDVQEAYLLGAAHCDRDRFIIRFMLRTGLRLGEVAALNVADIVPAPSGAMMVRVIKGKGGKDRRVPLDSGGRRFSDEVARYIAETRPASTNPALFLTRDNVGGWGGWSAKKRGKPERMREHSFQSLFRRLKEESGIQFNPHLCRHTFATRLVAVGVPAFAVQSALGHTTLAMTQRYVHYSTAHLEAAWAERKD